MGNNNIYILLFLFIFIYWDNVILTSQKKKKKIRSTPKLSCLGLNQNLNKT